MEASRDGHAVNTYRLTVEGWTEHDVSAAMSALTHYIAQLKIADGEKNPWKDNDSRLMANLHSALFFARKVENESESSEASATDSQRAQSGV